MFAYAVIDLAVNILIEKNTSEEDFMKISSIEIAGFGSFPDIPKRFTFDHDFTTITGNNGSGKTSILHAIVWALYGKPASRTGDMSSVVNVQSFKAKVLVEFETDTGGSMTVARTFGADSNNYHTLEVVVKEKGRKPVRKNSISTAQKYIETIFGDYATFSKLYMVDQHATGKFGSLIVSDPSSRREVVAAIANKNDSWKAIEKEAIAYRRLLKREIEDFKHEYKRIESLLETEFTPTDVQYTLEDKKQAERDLEQISEKIFLNRMTVKKEIVALRQQYKEEEAEAQQKIAELQKEANKQRDRRKAFEKHQLERDTCLQGIQRAKKVLQHAPAKRELQELETKISDNDRLELAVDGLCPMCGTDIEHVIDDIIDENFAFIERVENFDGNIKTIDHARFDLQQHTRRLEELDNMKVEQPSGLEDELFDEIQKIHEQVRNSPILRKIDELQDSLLDNELEDKRNALEKTIHTISRCLEQNQEQLQLQREYAKNAQKLQDLTTNIAQHKRKLAATEILVHAASDTGIASNFIVREAKQMCERANEILALMGSQHLSINVDVQYSTRLGKTTPDIFFMVGKGLLARDVQTLSSGEQGRVLAALSLGNSAVLEHRKLPILLDEPMAMVDTEAAEVFNTALFSLLDGGKVSQVIMTSRFDNAVNATQVPQKWEGLEES